MADLPFVTIRPTSLLRRLSDELCARAGFEPTVAFECHDLPTMRGFVGAGLGVAIVPAVRGVAAHRPTVPPHHLEITDDGAVRDVTMTWSAERRLLPAAELFRVHVASRADAGLLPPPADVG